MTEMTEAELLTALQESLRQAAEGPDGAMTTREIRKELGVGVRQAREIIRTLTEQGRIRPVRVKRPAIDGVMRPSTAYQMIPAEGGG